MLKFLHIENIAVIEQSDIEFSSGFNVLTGETGAGKSIIIDSINAVLGERTSKELIRNGCDSAEVFAVFSDLDSSAIKVLSENGISPDDDGNVIIRRRLSNSGKGIIKINDKPVTATLLREIGKYLINIHGQHDSQALLDPEKHYMYIDAVADDSDILNNYYEEFKNLNSIRKELQSLETDEEEKQHKLNLLKYQIDELKKAEIKIGEIEELKKNLEIAKTYESTVDALNKSYNALKGNEEFNGALSLLSSATRFLGALKNETFEKSVTKLNEAISLIDDVGAEISDFLDNSEFSNLDFEYINQRLDFLSRLCLKYGNSEEKMLEYLEDCENELEKITFLDEHITELSDKLDDATEKLVALADKLTLARKEHALKFETQVCDILKYLNMPNVKFTVDFQKGKYTRKGCDNIEFLISANEGENVKPLSKIASGGELSRVMLSIKSVLLDKDTVGTMIFDEIDTGISGFTAGKVGVQLKKVSKNRQVICVTHLAQIAAMADNHLIIQKNVVDGRTFTVVKPLNYEEKISEIARIMSGSELTENLYNSAKELVDRGVKLNENL